MTRPHPGAAAGINRTASLRMNRPCRAEPLTSHLCSVDGPGHRGTHLPRPVAAVVGGTRCASISRARRTRWRSPGAPATPHLGDLDHPAAAQRDLLAGRRPAADSACEAKSFISLVPRPAASRSLLAQACRPGSVPPCGARANVSGRSTLHSHNERGDHRKGGPTKPATPSGAIPSTIR